MDLRKAFDTVPRSLLWKALQKTQVPLSIIRSCQILYQHCSARVLTPEGPTKEVVSNAGVRQGCPLSPLLFAIFISKLQHMLEEHAQEGGALFELDVPLTCLLFADDVVIVSTSRKGLTRQLVVLQRFCDLTHMQVNMAKTRTIVFGPVATHDPKEHAWSFGSKSTYHYYPPCATDRFRPRDATSGDY